MPVGVQIRPLPARRWGQGALHRALVILMVAGSVAVPFTLLFIVTAAVTGLARRSGLHLPGGAVFLTLLLLTLAHNHAPAVQAAFRTSADRRR